MRVGVGLSAVVLGLASSTAFGQLLHHWKFDEAGGTTATDSVGGAPGTLVPGAQFVPNGASGNAVEIASVLGGYVTMGNIVPMTGGTPFSVSLWVKTAPGYSTHGIIAGVHTATVVAGYFIAVNAGGTYGAAGKAYFYQSVVPGGEPISTTTVNDGAWHHVVGVHRPGVGAMIFVDGAGVEGTKSAAGIGNANAPFVVGGLRNTSGALFNAFDGQVDDVQVYAEGLCSYDAQWLFDHPGQALPEIVCYADCDDNCSLDFFDFLCFQNEFGSGSAFADCDGSGTLDFFDFLCFQNMFGAGCP